MSAQKLFVKSIADAPKVRAFFKAVKPRGASIHFEGKNNVWLLKPTEKGGSTIGRIIDASDSEDVDAMINKIWAEETAKS